MTRKKSTFQDRCDDQAKGIVSKIDPETEKYFEDLAKRLGIGQKSLMWTDNEEIAEILFEK